MEANENLNIFFEKNSDRFIGETAFDDFKIIRGYINSSPTHLRLYYSKLEPLRKEAAICSICIIHGFGEHSSWFLHVWFFFKSQMAEHFVKANCIVHLVDLRGFGYKKNFCHLFKKLLRRSARSCQRPATSSGYRNSIKVSSIWLATFPLWA